MPQYASERPQQPLPADVRGGPEAKRTRPVLADEDLAAVVQARHAVPHQILGPHRSENGATVLVRTYLPGADRVTLRVTAPRRADVPMDRIHADGVFEALVHGSGPLSYRFLISDQRGEIIERGDAYAFETGMFTAEDEERFLAGRHFGLFEKLGAHLQRRGPVAGAAFAVWAPHAERVSVVGTFNNWDGRCHPMRRLPRSGVWELFIPDIQEGELYKFEIRTSQGQVFLKGDPFARRTEVAPANASIVASPEHGFRWSDAAWLKGRRGRMATGVTAAIRTLALEPAAAPVVPGQGAGDTPEATMADVLTHWRTQGYTHVELTPEPTGHSGSASVFAPDESRGTPERLMASINACHRAGLGVLMPLAGILAPERHPELAWFDGTPLYESGASGEGNATALDIAKGEIRSFLLSSAVYWFERYHADGWRTDLRTARLIRELSKLDPERFCGIPIIVADGPFKRQQPTDEESRLLAGRHDDPHSILGCHYAAGSDERTLRVFMPDAERIWARLDGEPELLYELQRIHAEGLFQTTLDCIAAEPVYRLLRQDRRGSSEEFQDAYAFREFSFSEADQNLFGAGTHYRIFEKLGAHLQRWGDVSGVRFAVWAPTAEGVSVVGSFNQWDGRRHPMHRHGLSGVWELFIPEIGNGELYKYEIRARNGHSYTKADPYAFYTEVAPATASIVYNLQHLYEWQDQAWMEQRQRSRTWEQPVAIYEVHLGSWLRDDDHRSLSYRAVAERLIAHVKDLGFTHIELLPISEYPYEPSWGYQVTGYYAPTSRYGRPEDLMYFIDLCHRNGIGVLLDWVAGHFPKDAHGLAWFDGTGLYEHEDPRKGEHRDWGTLVFNYGRHEVANFLIANALFWLEHYHFDGLRVDAVASMLYLDYSRTRPGEWIPNQYGGRENLEAIEFLRHTNVAVHRDFPGAMMVAEESTAWPNVSRPVELGGLGFGYKWNMGWMHDILDYLGTPPPERKYHHHTLTFSLLYAFAENYVLSLSHDEVVHMKRSLFNKMPGDEMEKFANLRLLYLFMYAHPGKKLLFMGAEFGQLGEWNHAASLEWHLRERKPHRLLESFLRDLNRLYLSDPAFFEVDFKAVGFEWLDADNAEDSAIAFLRKAKDPRRALLFIINFSTVSRPYFRVGVPFPVRHEVVMNSNAGCYGGADDGATELTLIPEEQPWNGREFSIQVPLPALCALVLRPAPPASC